jgi:hypothetical protein
MAATHQRYLNNPLQQFILDGEAELANLEEPARTIRAQSLFTELQRRFQPETTITIAEFTEKPTDTDVEHVVHQDQFDKLEDKEIEDGRYTHGDEGSGEPRFVSHLTVKSVDNSKPLKQVFLRGPDIQVIENLAAKDVDADLVSEGEIRAEARGYLDYKPARQYHDRVAKWMFKLQCKKAAKQELVCRFCSQSFEGRKGQKYCSDNCRKHRTPRPEEELDILETDDAVCTLFFQLRLEYLMQKYEVEELTSAMVNNIDVAEEQRLKDLAVYMVKESSNEQQ